MIFWETLRKCLPDKRENNFCYIGMFAIFASEKAFRKRAKNLGDELKYQKFVDLVCCSEPKRRRRLGEKKRASHNLNILACDPDYFLLLKIGKGEE